MEILSLHSCNLHCVVSKVQGEFDCCVGHSNGAHADPMQLALCGGVCFMHVHSGASSLQQQHGTTSASLLLLSV